jgi:hypothetical protein
MYTGLCGNWKSIRISTAANHFEIETIACQEFETQAALRECPEPAHRRNYFFMAALCENRDDAVWIRCIYKYADQEEEVLVDREVTDEDVGGK